MKFTIKEIAAKFNVEPVAAQGLVTFLRAINLAADTGDVQKAPGAKGKGSTIWEIPEKVLNDIAINISCPNPPTA